MRRAELWSTSVKRKFSAGLSGTEAERRRQHKVREAVRPLPHSAGTARTSQELFYDTTSSYHNILEYEPFSKEAPNCILFSAPPTLLQGAFLVSASALGPSRTGTVRHATCDMRHACVMWRVYPTLQFPLAPPAGENANSEE